MFKMFSFKLLINRLAKLFKLADNEVWFVVAVKSLNEDRLKLADNLAFRVLLFNEAINLLSFSSLDTNIYSFPKRYFG